MGSRRGAFDPGGTGTSPRHARRARSGRSGGADGPTQGTAASLSVRSIGERVWPAAGAADHQADHGGGARAEQDQEEQADAQRGEFGEESDSRRPHQEAEIAEAADGGDTGAFADLGERAPGGQNA